MSQSSDYIHHAAKPCYIGVYTSDGGSCIRAADNKVLLHSECIITNEELEYLCEAINFYEKAKLLNGTR